MNARLTSDGLAVVVPGNKSGCDQLTHSQLELKATHFAETLGALGLRPGDAIALLMGNRIEVPVIVLGARWAEIDVLSLSTHIRAESLAPLVETLQPRLLVASDDCIDLANQLRELTNPDIKGVLAIDDCRCDPSWLRYETIVRSYPSHKLIEKGNGQLLLTSGGSTGLQKIVIPQVMSDDSILDALKAVPATAEVFRVTDQDVTLVTGPLYHTMGLSVMTSALNAGAKLVIMPRWDAQAFMENIEVHGVTRTMVVPTMMARVNSLLDSLAPDHYDIRTLKVVVHGAAPCAKSVKVAFMGHFPNRVFEAYGGTEGFGTTIATPNDWESHPGTVGRPLGQVVIRDEDDNDVPDGVPGIIWGIIPQGTRPMSYLGRKAETNECIVEREGRLEGTLWDIGYMKHGLLFITGRKKDMIIVGGVNTYPIEIEDVLHRHPRVVDAAVVGIPHDTLGEVPAAAVEIIGEGSDTLAAELHALCVQAGLHAHAIPKKIIFGDLPRTATGKMPKNEVRKLMLAS